MKIISLVPAETELLCDLGLESQLIAVTKECVYPYYIRVKKKCLGTEDEVVMEELKALQPDIILCNVQIHSEAYILECKKIAKVHTSDIRTIDDVLQLITAFGELFNCRTTAINLIHKLKYKFKDFMRFIRGSDWQKVAYFVSKSPWSVKGGDTFTNHLLSLNNFRNIYSEHKGVSEVKIKRIRLDGDPDCVFLSSKDKFTDASVFELGRCTHHAKAIFVDEEMFSWGGSRLLKSFEYFKKLHSRIGEK